MYSSLMGTFDIPAPINYLGSMSVGKSITMVINKTDPWVLPTHHEPQFPLFAVEVDYQSMVETTIDSIMTPSTVSEESEETYLHTLGEKYLYSYDCLDMVFPLEEAIW